MVKVRHADVLVAVGFFAFFSALISSSSACIFASFFVISFVNSLLRDSADWMSACSGVILGGSGG
ncbi:hypothetical protein [Bacillus haynesii]|uniref:hypothetical protein n=1 Tax=Bacillus haynesii TaxID=1925021 RepID=UPI001F624624|nr:hypothetical protein [Bacillus haynesii]MCI4129441.1 hypothetical protein [Bacillus haynesii]